MEAQLTPGAVPAIADQPNGPGLIKPVVQVVDVRPVNTKAATAATAHSERFRMVLSDGVHAQQSMLATALNHLVRDRTIRPGSIVHLEDIMCNNVQNRRIIIVVKLDVLQSECAIIGSPKMYESKVVHDSNLPANAAQTNSGAYSGGPGNLGSSVAPRTEQVANNLAYGGSYNGVQAMAGNSLGQTVEPGPNNVLSGASYGTMSVQNTMHANMMQPSLNPHQNQRFAVPATGGGFSSPGNSYGRSAKSSYQQPPPAYMNRGPVAKNEAAPRVIPISALNPYQGRWTIKARVTAKTNLRDYVNAKGPGKVFSFDLLDAQGGEIRATCFNEALDQFYGLIEVDKVYLISRGSVKPAQKKFNPLNNDYEVTLDMSTSIEICSDDDSSIPRMQYNFRPISDIENMDIEAMVDLLGVVTSVSPTVTIMRKNGMETQKRTLQLKDMSCRSVEVTLWGNFCNSEGQQLQSQCDSGLNPILALKGGRIGEFNGRSVGTISTSQLKINPEFPDAERLRQWYITEGKTAGFFSLSREMSSMGRTDIRKTTAQIKEENLGRSEKPDWITIKGALSHLNTDSFCYPACPLEVNGKRCNKKVSNNGDGMWHCDKCDQSFKDCEYRYLLLGQIQDHTGMTYATAFQEVGEEIFGLTAQELFKIKFEEQDGVRFADIMQGARWHQYLFKVKVKEEIYNDEPRVKCSIVKAEKLDPSKESLFLLGGIDSLLQNGSGSAPGVNGAAAVNAGFTNSEPRQSVLTSNNGYAMNMGGPNQFGQQPGISGGMSAPLSVSRNVQTCSACGSSGHNSQSCPVGIDRQQQPAGGGFTGSFYSSSAGNATSGLCYKCSQPGHFARDCPGQATGNGNNASSGLCYKCSQPGHFARDCPGQATGTPRQTYGNGAPSGGYNRQSFVGGF